MIIMSLNRKVPLWLSPFLPLLGSGRYPLPTSSKINLTHTGSVSISDVQIIFFKKSRRKKWFGVIGSNLTWNQLHNCQIPIASDIDAFPKQPRALNSPSWRTGPTCRCHCFSAQTVFLSAREISF